MRFDLPGASPELAQAIGRFFRQVLSFPLRLWRAPTADLPTASTDNEGGIVYDETTSRPAYSDGAAWKSLMPYDADLAVIAALADPNADRILFWDDSAGAYAFLRANTGLTVSGTDLNISLADPTSAVVLWEDFFTASETGEIGTHNWTFGGYSSLSDWTAEANHPGIILLTTPAAAGTVCTFRLGSAVTSQNVINLSMLDEFTWVFRESAAGVTDLDMRLGVFANMTAVTNDWLGIERLTTDTNWHLVARASGSQTRTDTTVAAGTAGWFKAKFRRISATEWRVSINGAAEIAVTSNVPTTAMQPGLSIVASAVSRTFRLDFFSMVTGALTR